MDRSSANRKQTWYFPRFSAEDDEKLIDEVSGRELLWNFNHEDFKNPSKKDQEWNIIGEKLDKTGDVCRKRWKHIRDNFIRHRKIQFSSATKGPRKKRASYWEKLSFLQNLDEDGQGSSKADEDDGKSEAADLNSKTTDKTVYLECIIEEDEFAELDEAEQDPQKQQTSKKSASATKRKLGNADLLMSMAKQRKRDRAKPMECVQPVLEPLSENELDLFFKTMAATVKKFTPQQIIQVKMDIFNVVAKMEMYHCSRVSDIATQNSACSPSSTKMDWQYIKQL